MGAYDQVNQVTFSSIYSSMNLGSLKLTVAITWLKKVSTLLLFSDIEGLKRKLSSKLSVHGAGSVPDWEVCEFLLLTYLLLVGPVL